MRKTDKASNTYAAWAAACARNGYEIQRKENARLGVFHVALFRDSPVGSFCAKYPKDSFLLPPAEL